MGSIAISFLRDTFTCNLFDSLQERDPLAQSRTDDVVFDFGASDQEMRFEKNFQSPI